MYMLQRTLIIASSITVVIAAYYYGSRASEILMRNGDWYQLKSSDGVIVSSQNTPTCPPKTVLN